MGKKKVRKSSLLKKNRSIVEPDLLATAIQYHKAGQLDQAIKIYQKIFNSHPNHHVVLNLFGLALHAKGQSDNALTLLSKAASLAPEIAKYHYDLGVVSQNSEKDDDAIRHYRAALKLEPKNGAAWENLGVALFDCGQNEAAVFAFETALNINQKSILALTNLSTLRCWEGQYTQALELLDIASVIDPTHIPTHMKRAETLLALGSFQQGWEEYSWRFLGAGRPGQDPVRFVPLPKWDGNNLGKGTLLVYTEQGIGDEVMFASCFPDLLTQCPDCHFLCDPRMVTIFKRSFPGLKVSPNVSSSWGVASETLKADVRLPLGDLPRLFRKDYEQFSQQESYLKADDTLVSHWSRRLSQLGPGLKIGISWRGGRRKYNQRARSIPLELFTPLLSLHNVLFVNLQYGDCKEDLLSLPEDLQQKIFSFAEVDPLSDLDTFFAVIKGLDLVISIDNSTVHFAGALGVPTLLLLPALSDWRWPVEGSDSRWYSKVKLIRQQPAERGNWSAVIDCAVKKVATLKVEEDKASNISESPPKKQAMPVFPSFQTGTPKALLLNDTSFWYHWGCTGTSLAIRNNLRERGWAVRGVPIYYLRSLLPVPANFNDWDDALFDSFRNLYVELCESLEQADVLVVNGEGSLHGHSPLSINLLYLMYIAKSYFGKPVHVINHSCYPDDQAEPKGSEIEKTYQYVYSKLDYVAVREPVSRVLLENLGIETTQSFDCLPLFIEQFRRQIQQKESGDIIFSGSVAWTQEIVQAVIQLTGKFSGGRCKFLFGANAYPAGDDIIFIQQLQKALSGQVELVHATSELDWLSQIASAKLLISGRFHHSIAAACLDTPFIVLDSNTPKISGLMQVLELQTHISSNVPQFSCQLKELATALYNDPGAGLLSVKNHKKILMSAKNNFIGLG